MATITTLPLEILRQISENLGYRDLLHFIQSYPGFWNQLLGSHSYSEELVQKYIPGSEEAALAARGKISNRKALTALFQKQDAFARGRPFEVMSLEPGEEFIYRGGALCMRDKSLVEVIDPRAKTKTHLNLSTVLSLRTSDADVRYNLLNYSAQVLSFRVDTGSSSAVVSLKLTDRGGYTRDKSHITSIRTTDTHVEVRNNEDYVVVAALRPTEEEDAWQFQASSLDRTSPSRYSRQLDLGQFTSSDIGVDLVFEVIDGYFWVMSSQITVDPEGADPTSYYGGCRSALAEPSQQPEFWRMQRRKHTEGPIDESWTTLGLLKDTQGDYLITEARNEWHSDGSKSRSFYSALFRPQEYKPAPVETNDAHAVVTLARNASTDEFDAVEEIIAGLPDSKLTVYPEHRVRHPEFGSDSAGHSTNDPASAYPLHQRIASFFNQLAEAFADLVIERKSPTGLYDFKLRFGARHIAPVHPRLVEAAQDASVTGSSGHGIPDMHAITQEAHSVYIHEPIVMFPDNPNTVFSRYKTEGRHGTKHFADDKAFVFGPDFQENSRAAQRSDNHIVIISFDPLASWSGSGAEPDQTPTQQGEGSTTKEFADDDGFKSLELLSFLTRTEAALPLPEAEGQDSPVRDPSGNDNDLQLDPIQEEMRDALAEAAQEAYLSQPYYSETDEDDKWRFHGSYKRRKSSESLGDLDDSLERPSAEPFARAIHTSSSALQSKRAKTDEAGAESHGSKEAAPTTPQEIIARSLGLLPQPTSPPDQDS